MSADLRSGVEAEIREAFRGVVLGGGVSLQQAELIDEWNDTLTEAEFAAIPDLEVTDDWSAVSGQELEMDNIAHLDPEGLRYYLPAYLLYMLDSYVGGEMWTIGTISALDQRYGHPLGFMELLTLEQKRAIAGYVRAVPSLTELDPDDQVILERALQKVWARYLADAETQPP